MTRTFIQTNEFSKNWDSLDFDGEVFILAEMYRRSGGTDTAVPVEVYRQTGTGYRLHHSG